MGLFAKKSIVGLDLGHYSFKVVQMERAGQGWKVTKTAQMPTPPDCVRDGIIVDLDAASFAVKQMLRENQIDANTANVAVSGGAVVVRNVRIPRMNEATLRKSIKFEASRYVPNNVDDSYVEFEILGDADENQIDVLVVAAPRDLVDSRLRVCADCGLEVESVDIETFATYRSLIEFNQETDYSHTTIALVDIGSMTTNISVVHKGNFAMSRSIGHGGQLLSDALKSYFKLSDADAEAGKAQLDVAELVDDATPRENPPLRVLQPHLDDMVREVRRSLNYYQSQQGDTQQRDISLIVLTGGGSKLPGLAQYIENKLAIPAISVGVYDNPRITNSAVSEGQGMDYSVAAGLAMRAFLKAA